MDLSQKTLLRIAAFLVDAVSMSIVLILPASIVSYILAWFGGAVKAIGMVWMAAAALWLIGMLLRDGYRGRSPGKQMLGLRIVTPRGDRCGYGRSVIRNVPLLLLPVEVLLVLLNRARIGDRIARTTVTEE